MCLTGTLLRSVLVAVLLAYSCGKRRCNYKEILGSYREVIFVELQNLVEFDCFTQYIQRERPLSLRKGKCHYIGHTFSTMDRARRILVSIYGMTQQMRCQRSGKKQSDLEKPVESMEQLIAQNCSPQYLGKRASCSAVQKIRGKKKKRMRLIRVVKALITCWQKLQSVHVLSK